MCLYLSLKGKCITYIQYLSYTCMYYVYVFGISINSYCTVYMQNVDLLDCLIYTCPCVCSFVTNTIVIHMYVMFN